MHPPAREAAQAAPLAEADQPEQRRPPQQRHGRRLRDGDDFVAPVEGDVHPLAETGEVNPGITVPNAKPGSLVKSSRSCVASA